MIDFIVNCKKKLKNCFIVQFFSKFHIFIKTHNNNWIDNLSNLTLLYQIENERRV